MYTINSGVALRNLFCIKAIDTFVQEFGVYTVEHRKKNSMARAITLLVFLLVAHVLAGRRKSSGRCSLADVSELGGSSSAMLSTFQECLPQFVSESNLEVMEECSIKAFAPESVSKGCKRCALQFLDDNELNLKLCFVKCQGVSSMANPCLKCKDELIAEWDSACFPSDTYQLDESKSSTVVSELSVVLMCIVVIFGRVWLYFCVCTVNFHFVAN